MAVRPVFGNSNFYLHTGKQANQLFDGYLYAGVSNMGDGAQIFRSEEGEIWVPVSEPGFGIPHDTAPPAILDLMVFSGRLYATTGRGDGPGQIWRTLNGTTWAPMVISGFSDPDTVDMTTLAVYDGMIYVGATNLVSGAQIWRSFTGDNNSWVQVAPEVAGTDAAAITGFAEFDGMLYAAVESDAPAQIWRSYGTNWTAVVSDGFGSELTTLTGGMVEFAGYLYVGAGHTTKGAQLWRTNDGAIWEQVVMAGFSEVANSQVESVFVFENQLYVSVANQNTGLELWRSADGSTGWEQVNQDGFGDSHNSGTNDSNATAVFLNHLYLGTANSMDGGELWRLTPAFVPTHGLTIASDSTLAGLPSATVTYTLAISNSGNITDSYHLTIEGNSWPTVLASSGISLTPSSASQVTVSVTIPSDALATDMDLAVVRATSQGDGLISATVQLTTTVLPVYGVYLSPSDSLVGLPGQIVTYTVTISNSGNTADTFDLAITNHVWLTAISTSTIALTAGDSHDFDVVVKIPAVTTADLVDVVALTATSRGDKLTADIVHLTTICLDLDQRLYLPAILKSP